MRTILLPLAALALLAAPAFAAPVTPVVVANTATADPDDGVAEYAARIANEGDLVDPQVYYDLALIGSTEALEVLKGALETLTDKPRREYVYDACAIFARLRAKTEALAFLSHAAAKNGKAIDRLAATRALCAFDPEGRDALLELAQTSEDPDVRHAAGDGLAPYLLQSSLPEHIDLALDLALVAPARQTRQYYVGLPRRDRASFEGLTHRETLARCAKTMRAGRALEHALDRLVRGKVTKAWRRVLVDALGTREEPVVVQTLIKLLREPDPLLVLSCLDHLLAHRERGAWDTYDEDLPPLLSSNDEAVRRAAVIALGAFGAGDPRWRSEIMEMSEDKDLATRQGAARALGELRSPEAIERLFVLFAEDDDWRVRYEALKAIEKLRLPESLGLLVGRIEHETLRMRDEISFALRMLTGVSIATNRWVQWYADHGEGFELPTFDEAVAAEDERRKSRAASGGGTTTGFFDLQIVSDRVIFICDMSSSMEEPAKEVPRTGGSVVSSGRDAMTRFNVAKLQLLAVLKEIPDDTLFNVLFFSHVLEPFNKRMQRMKRSTRAKAMKWVRDQFPNGSTNVWDAILTAYLEPSVDTIYLLTDGHPTDGAITDTAEIRERVKHWNATRHITIHSISLGRYSPLLEGLAQDSGGSYVEFL